MSGIDLLNPTKKVDPDAGINSNPFLNTGVPDPLDLAPPASVPGIAIETSEVDSIGGPVKSKEAQLNWKAYQLGPIDTVVAEFNSGGNWANTVFKRFEREQLGGTGPDPLFNPDQFIEQYRNSLTPQAIKQIKLANNRAEAQAIVSDTIQELRDQDILQRRSEQKPISTFVLRALASIVDLDTPIAFATGGAVKLAKGGTLAKGAVAGGVSQGVAAGMAYEAGTTGDWTMIPSAGLAGVAFGALGAAAARRAPDTSIPKKGEAAPDIKPDSSPDIKPDINLTVPTKPRDVEAPVSKSSEELANDSLDRLRAEFKEYMETMGAIERRDIRTETFIPADDVYGTRRAIDAEIRADEGPAPKTEGTRGPEAFDIQDVAIKPDSNGENLPGFGTPASAGAQTLQANPLQNITNTRSRQIISDAIVWERQQLIPDNYADAYTELANKADPVAKSAYRFHEAIKASGLATDFDRLVRAGSSVGKKLAYDIMESASGVVRNNRSASMLKLHYEKQLLGAFLPAYDEAWQLYAKDKGLSWYDRKFLSGRIQEEFNELIYFELNGRAYDPPGTVRSVHPAVKAAADAHDEWAKLDVAIGKGREGEFSIKGYEDIEAYSGYVPQRWSSDKIERLIRNGRNPADISAAIAEAYQLQHPGMGAANAKLFADAVVRRARANATGVDTNLIGMLRADGRGFLEDMLRSNGIPQKEIDSLLDTLTTAAAERGQKGYTKSRIDVDMRTTASNGIKMIDLFETDLVHNISRRSRGTSGNAALARKGIRSLTDRNDIKAAILDEQQARGPSHSDARNIKERINDIIDEDKNLSAEDIDNMFSYFDGGPVAGGLSPTVIRMKRLTNLALLNGLGITQLAETGAQMSVVGINRWWDHAGAALKAATNDPKSELAKDLRHLSIMVPEHRLYRDDLNLDMNVNGTAQSDLLMRLDRVLGVGQRVQGYISGYYAVQNVQQRIAITSAADKIMTNMKGLRDDLSGARAEDLGLDPKTYARIKKYVDNGTVEFKDGVLYKLNFDKWDADTAEDFALSLNRHVNQVVQKAMIGEGNILFSTSGIAALFAQLKTFPLLAVEKQLLRNMKFADQEALATFFYGLATAATAYTAAQAVKGNTQNLSSEKIAKGAIGYSNMTGWIPMWTDPVMNVLGIDSLKFNEYARGIDSNVFAVPASITTLNRMANIPGALFNVATGNYTNNDVRALQTTPLIGNLYGFSAALNAMKHDRKKPKSEEPTEQPTVPEQDFTPEPNPSLLDITQ